MSKKIVKKIFFNMNSKAIDTISHKKVKKSRTLFFGVIYPSLRMITNKVLLEVTGMLLRQLFYYNVQFQGKLTQIRPTI